MLCARRPPRAAVALARWRAAAVAIGARERVREEAEVCARRVAATEQAARMQVVQQAQALQAKLELLSRSLSKSKLCAKRLRSATVCDSAALEHDPLTP